MGTPQGVSESRWKWLDTPGVSLAGRAHDDRNHEGYDICRQYQR
jgi:hypothetical protein